MTSSFWRVVLHKDSRLLIAVAVSLWFTISMSADARYDVKKLQPHTGQVSEVATRITRIKNKLFYKDTTIQLRIRLGDAPEYFTIAATGRWDSLTHALAVGDTATVYTKEKLWGIFGLGNRHTIAHLVKHPTNQVLIDFRKNQQANFLSVFITAFATIGFLVWYIVRLRRRMW
jgi:hypothetical protein